MNEVNKRHKRFGAGLIETVMTLYYNFVVVYLIVREYSLGNDF